MNLEETLRQKIGCYTRCTTFNASCHATCVEYEEKVLPELNKEEPRIFQDMSLEEQEDFWKEIEENANRKF